MTSATAPGRPAGRMRHNQQLRPVLPGNPRRPAAVDADDQPDLHSLAYGIKRDQQAVLNRLTMP